MRSRVYLQSGFWEKLSENTSREGIRTMLDLSDAIVGSEVIADLSEEMISQDKFLMIILKQGRYKRCDEQYIEKQIETMGMPHKTENLCATYMLDKKTTECKTIEDKYGIVVLDSTSIYSRNYIFKGDGFSLNKKECYSRRYLTFKNNLYHPCNSLIIIDPYLLLKKKYESEEPYYSRVIKNLESLLDAILPLKLSITFHLTIISSLEVPDELRRMYEKIRKVLKRIRQDLSVILCIVYISKGYNKSIESFHSRHILSNTYAIDSEDGFELFDNNGYILKNNPSVSIVFPRMYGDNRQDITKYFNWISSVKNYINEAPETYVYGDKGNRLFDLIQP